MRPRLLALILPVAVALTLPTVAAVGQEAPPASLPVAAPNEPVPFDPAVRRGTLPNGLTFYIRRNTRPEQRVSMQLAVKAGSVDEEDDQQGLAHFLEHMAFNGTKRFEPGELVAALEAIGARLGPHLNAYTSFNETVYMFQLPTDRPGLVETGLQALADFAAGITLDPKEIEKERGVVLEEWRGGLGAGSRLRDQQMPVVFHGSKYAERLPIGKPDVLRTFPPERLRAFYEKWYRPDRMAVVVVGDIDEAEIEALITKEFGALPKPERPAPERNYGLPLHDDLLVNVATDPEATGSSASVLRKRREGEEGTVGAYRQNLVERLGLQMLNERFDELARRPDASFLSAGAYRSPLTPSVQTIGLGATVQEGRIREGLAALIVESNRVVQHGYGAGELDRAKRRILAAYDRAYAERDKTESGAYVQEYVSHFLYGEPSPGIEWERNTVHALLPGIGAAEIANAARDLFADRSRVILAVSPRKEELPVPDEEALRAVVAKAEEAPVTAWADEAATGDLMAGTPDPAKVTARRELPDLGVTIVRFANGVDAWLKPTDFKNDEVLFTLASPGGSSLAPPETYYEATLSPALVQLSGAGGHNAVQIQRLLAGTSTSSGPYISLSQHGISGGTTPANLETALQLLHIQFTAPENDADAFARLKKNLEAAYLNRSRDPDAVFAERVAEINTGGHYTARPLTPERIAKLDREAMARYYRERFSNAANFTFFLVGAFDVDEALPLLASYVGSLPSAGRPDAEVEQLGMEFPEEIVRERVVQGREPRARSVVSFFAEPPLEEQEQTYVEAATVVLQITLRDTLREELGETYGVSVGLVQPLPQRGAGRIAVGFGGAPDNIGRMVDRVFAEVRRLKKEGPSEDLTNRAKESARRSYEIALRQNGYWISRLQSAKLLDRDPGLILTRDERIDAITPGSLHEVFTRYFPDDRYTVVTLLPEQQ